MHIAVVMPRYISLEIIGGKKCCANLCQCSDSLFFPDILPYQTRLNRRAIKRMDCGDTGSVLMGCWQQLLAGSTHHVQLC